MDNMETQPSPSTHHIQDDASAAPSHPLPSTHLYSVEFPGYVKPSSVSLALQQLGGASKIHAAFQRTGNKSPSLVELNFHPQDSFFHPINGEVVSTNNILVKIVKRKWKRTALEQEGTVGEHTAEVLGVIPKTGRFRAMADYQYQANLSDPVSELRSAMDNMNVASILQYSISQEKEDYSEPLPHERIHTQPLEETLSQSRLTTSNLRLPPPPLFSRQAVPQNYNFKANTASVVSATIEDSGEERRRLINRMRWKNYGPVSVYYTDKDVPTVPTAAVAEQRSQADQKLLHKLEQLFQERPVWTRAAILNQFELSEIREIINSKFLLPLVSYVFQDGPWRDTQVRLGYDPRIDPEARFYQRLYFRNINKPIVRPSVVGRRQEGRNEIASARTSDASGKQDRRSHVFDGVSVTKETAAFQLCDIEDEMLKGMIQNEEDIRETCNERDGWYSSHMFEQIKTVLRHKFFSLLAGHVATQEECDALLFPSDGTDKMPTRSTHRLRPGKHNMAKGALRPEDAAAQRLMATLDQRMKGFSGQR